MSIERFSQWRWERKLRRETCGVIGCCDIICRAPQSDHKPCRCCNAPTPSKRLWIDRASLRRRIVPICDSCAYFNQPESQKRLKAERVRRDWDKITVPVNSRTIDTEQMAEQYPGIARETLRAFLASQEEFATVTSDLSASSIEKAISTLGLEKDIHVEQRDNTTVLRKTEK